METLKKKTAVEVARVRFEISQKQLAEAQIPYEKAEDDFISYSNKYSGTVTGFFDTLFENLGATGEQELRDILHAYGDVFHQARRVAKQYEDEYIRAQADAGPLGAPTPTPGAGGGGGSGSGTAWDGSLEEGEKNTG